MKKIKILYLHSGAELYGADQILLTTVCNLNKEKFEPIVLLPNKGPLVNKLKEKNIRVEIMNYPIIRRKYFNIKGMVYFLHDFFRDSKNICTFVKAENITIVHNNTIAVLEGIYVKRKTKVKLVTHVHEMIDHPKIVAKILYTLHLKNCDKMVVVSHAVKNHIEKLLKIKREKIVVIHNGIEQIKFKNKKDYRKEFNIPHDSKVVAVIGRINSIKGQDHFINAMEKVVEKNNNVYGLIIGDAFENQEWRVQQLKELIIKKNLHNRIIYCGFRNDVNEIYQIIDALVLPSIQNDSFPTVVLEAMSCGIPTIAYKCGGVEEMINDGVNGYLVEQGNYYDLADKILKLINSIKSKESVIKIFDNNYNIKLYTEKLEKEYIDLGDNND